MDDGNGRRVGGRERKVGGRGKELEGGGKSKRHELRRAEKEEGKLSKI